MFKAIPSRQGQPRVNAVCDDCGREECIPCQYVRHGEPDEGQATKKIQQSGWAVVKGSLRCPSCEAKRKAAVMTVAKKAKRATPSEEAPRQATPKQKREIIKLLEEVIDEDARRYVSGESDETVAAAVGGGCMPGWVADLREEIFDATGDSNDMEEVLERLRTALDEEAEEKKIIAGYSVLQRKREEKIANLIKDVEAIKQAQGKRVCARAGVK